MVGNGAHKLNGNIKRLHRFWIKKYLFHRRIELLIQKRNKLQRKVLKSFQKIKKLKRELENNTCKFCRKIYDYPWVARNCQETCGRAPNPCPACNQVFVLRQNLVTHYMAIHLCDFRLYKCSECKWSSNYASNVKRHLNKVHGTETGRVIYVGPEERNRSYYFQTLF